MPKVSVADARDDSSSAAAASSSSEAGASMRNFPFLKSFGQHILKNPMIIQAMVEKAGIRETDTVLEIGPGTGNLTHRLLEVSKKVIVVERDPRMVVELQKRFHGTPLQRKLKIIHGDVMKVEFPYFDVCCANIPYQISSPLTFKLLTHRPFFRTTLLMYQREFALRVVARPNDDLYCRLSVNCQLLANCTHVMKVGKNNFRPPPKVESSIVRFEQRTPPPPISFVEWDGMVRLCFSRKNKTLGALFRATAVLKMLEHNRNTYCALQQLPKPDTPIKDAVTAVLAAANMQEERAAKLDIDDFLALLHKFQQSHIRFA